MMDNSHQLNLESVKQCLTGHLRKTGFQDGLRVLLRKHEFEWDEPYIWDCFVGNQASQQASINQPKTFFTTSS
jgi:hypothetical protein